MRTRGFDNWPEQFPRRLVAGNAERDELYVVERGGLTVATLVLQWNDEFFWGADDAHAGYVHRLAVRRAHAGGGLGYRLLAWAGERVLEHERRVLRLDVVSENRRLRAFYEAAGFVHVRDLSGEITNDDGSRRAWQTTLYERECLRPKT